MSAARRAGRSDRTNTPVDPDGRVVAASPPARRRSHRKARRDRSAKAVSAVRPPRPVGSRDGNCILHSPWAKFFVAEVGASAALVGLLFVAVSINLTKIIQFPTLPGRAFEALVILVLVLFVATFGLVPGQSSPVLGIEISSTALAGWSTTVFIQVTAPKDPSAPRSWMLSRIVTAQLATVPMSSRG